MLADITVALGAPLVRRRDRVAEALTVNNPRQATASIWPPRSTSPEGQTPMTRPDTAEASEMWGLGLGRLDDRSNLS